MGAIDCTTEVARAFDEFTRVKNISSCKGACEAQVLVKHLYSTRWSYGMTVLNKVFAVQPKSLIGGKITAEGLTESDALIKQSCDIATSVVDDLRSFIASDETGQGPADAQKELDTVIEKANKRFYAALNKLQRRKEIFEFVPLPPAVAEVTVQAKYSCSFREKEKAESSFASEQALGLDIFESIMTESDSDERVGSAEAVD